MSRIAKPAVIGLMVVAAFVALAYGPRLITEPRSGGGLPAAAAAAADRPIPVMVETVRLQPERVRVEAVGTSRARASVTLHPAVAGEVTAVNFQAGQRVRRGDVLVELDPEDEALALELARVRLTEAERDLDRHLRMRESGAVTPAAVDTARTAAQLARLEVQRAELALEDRFVRAPFDGHIGITEVDPGDRIGPDTPIATLDDRSVLLVSFEVPELLMGRLSTGDPIAVTTWSAAQPQARGHIADIGTRVDPESRTFAARARVDNPEDRLRPGMSFRVQLRFEGRSFPVVPEVSLQWGGEGSFVWTLRDGRAERVPVTLVQRDKGHVLVDAALGTEDQVVTEGVQRMRQGLAVAPQGQNMLAAEENALDNGAGAEARP